MPTVILLARIAHEANRHYCVSIGDNSQVPWDQAHEWQQQSAIMGVTGVLRGNTPEDSHVSWLKQKQEEGWKYGPVKDPEKKEHPCFVPYAELSEDQKLKDHLFVQTVRGAAQALGISLTKAPQIAQTNPHANPFVYMKPTEQGVKDIEAVRSALKDAYDVILAHVPAGRERALAITKLEEASMWANKGIAFGGR